MSIEVVKAGLSDTIQDGGRFGFQHLGINPGGAMDVVSMQVANFLVGNARGTPVIEFCFPASSLRFNSDMLIALSGADFSAVIDGVDVPINQIVCVPAQSLLVFKKVKQGSYCYLACRGGFEIGKWLGSFSTNTKVMAGGVNGRSLKKGDIIPFVTLGLAVEKLTILKWRADVADFYTTSKAILCTIGNEFSKLTKKSQIEFQKKKFKVTAQRDRMGYSLEGIILKRKIKDEFLSTGVNFGTVQLLPTGQLICLTADHQTTGGYPRVAHVLSSYRTNFVQLSINQEFSFQFVSLKEAEQSFLLQQASLSKCSIACSFAINHFLKK
jgi:antagonist of KipI